MVVDSITNTHIDIRVDVTKDGQEEEITNTDTSGEQDDEEDVEDDLLHINDNTITLNPAIDRHWLKYYRQSKRGKKKSKNKAVSITKPKIRLLLTDFGWNHPDPQQGIAFYRSIRSRELLRGFVDHPYFDPTVSWSMDSANDRIDYDANVLTIVMLDLETCFEGNYPYYGNTDPSANTDKALGRQHKASEESLCYYYKDCLQYINQVLQSPLFQKGTANDNTQLLLVDCTSDHNWPLRFPTADYRENTLTSSQLSLIPLSVSPDKIQPASDFGLPPPEVSHPILEADAMDDITTCQSEDNTKRNYYISFSGDDRRGYTNARVELFRLNNDRDIILKETHDFQRFFRSRERDVYDTVMKRSRFAAVPRGDCLFSYRFSEVLAAGAVPVVFSDNWVLPFRQELIDWSDCIVLIPERDALRTLDILRQISEEKRCQMRQRCWEIYQTYMATPAGTMRGIVESIVAMKEQQKKEREPG